MPPHHLGESAEIHHYLTILIHSSPEIMLLAIDLDENFINIEFVAITLMSALQSTGVLGSEFDTPQSDRPVADYNATFGQ